MPSTSVAGASASSRGSACGGILREARQHGGEAQAIHALAQLLERALQALVYARRADREHLADLRERQALLVAQHDGEAQLVGQLVQGRAQSAAYVDFGKIPGFDRFGTLHSDLRFPMRARAFRAQEHRRLARGRTAQQLAGIAGGLGSQAALEDRQEGLLHGVECQRLLAHDAQRGPISPRVLFVHQAFEGSPIDSRSHGFEIRLQTSPRS